MSDEAPVPATPEAPAENGTKINVPILIASLLMSLMLWGMVYSQTSNTSTRSLTVRLQTIGLDETKYVVTRKPISLSVSVTASADRFRELEAMSDRDMYGVIQLGGVHDGVNQAPVTLFPTKLREVAVLQLPKVSVTVEAVRRKTVPVRIRTIGQPNEPDGVSLTEVSVSPERVEVSGPESQIANVTEARGEIDLTAVDPSTLEAYPVQTFAWSPRRLDPDQFRTEPQTVQVTPIFTSAAQQKQISVTVSITGTPAKGFGMSDYILNPPVVTASGTPAALAGLQKLETDPIDVSGMKADTTFTVSIRRPQGIRLVSPSSVRVRVNIRPMAKTGAR